MFFDRPASGELAVLVSLNFDSEAEPENPREFEELVLSAGGDPVAEITGRRSAPHAKYFVGSGKLAEIGAAIADTGAQLVIFNHDISPSQERNIEHELCCRVLDRTGLILDIFAQRAQTHEGKLQVELAQLEYLSTRLVRGWTHLERQKGGIGLRGPGETQLEMDRRLIRGRIASLHRRLAKVRRQRDQGRRSRRRSDVATVSLVGYTNAGKSTLFNRLTNANVYAADKLFATLDPTMRAVNLPHAGNTVVADTVGFISHLPHKLVEAFRATLEEAANATLLLHVIDASSSEMMENIERVESVLAEIGAADIPRLSVYNKIDLLEDSDPHVEYDAAGRPRAVWISAQNAVGLDVLSDAVGALLASDQIRASCHIPASEGRLRARLYAAQAVLAEHRQNDGSTIVDIRTSRSTWQRLLKIEGLNSGKVVYETEEATKVADPEALGSVNF